MPLILDADVVVYLDEDNWFEPEHISSCVSAMLTSGTDWAYSLRRICASSGLPVCEDDCDSLGFWPKHATLLDGKRLSDFERELHVSYPHLVDMSCLAIARTLAVTVAPLWVNLHADSVVGTHLVHSYAGVCTGEATVNYSLGGGSETPKEWFLEGNELVRQRYEASNSLPWRTGPIRLEPGVRRHPSTRSK